jgi:hypothetical protein
MGRIAGGYQVIILSGRRCIPQECDRWRGLDATVVNISCGAGDDAAQNEAHDNADVLEERRAEERRQDDADERKEAKPDEFRGIPPMFTRQTEMRGRGARRGRTEAAEGQI